MRRYQMNHLRLLSVTALLVSLSVSVSLAQLTVHGTVTDQSGAKLAGANILEKGTKRGTTTNTDGEYTYTYQNPDAVLAFSMVGFKKQEIRPSGKTQLDVSLQEGLTLSEVTVVGTRNPDRSATETPVPVDVLDVSELTTHQGQVDVNQLLQYAAPSFNANRQSGADGADHIDPATLRGLGPDQTLVLVNGKRRHQSSLVNLFGTRGRGNTGTDLDAIPASAIDHIEILRDGASAQYGSDAIAGVINIVLKSDVDQFDGGATTGAHSAQYRTDRDYDGEEFQSSGNYGVHVGDAGFTNFTVDYTRKGRTNRPTLASSLPAYRQEFGDAELNNLSTFFNSGIPVGEQSKFYAFGGLNFRHTDAYAWTRDPGSERNVLSIYPNGFNPRIVSDIIDPSLSLGWTTAYHNWNIDFNNTYGKNRFHYFVDGTLNASLLDNSPTRFDAGGFGLSQNTTSINFVRPFEHVLSGFNAAFGLEYRIENYELFAGEEASWKTYGPVIFSIDTTRDSGGNVVSIDTTLRPGGSQGFPGFRPDNVVDENRSEIGAYSDLELDVTREWMVDGAVRYESYSDFGNTVNGKIATRYKVNDQLALRGSVSSGFRAPSLAQLYFNAIYTDFVAGKPIDKVIAKNNSPITRKLGIPPLKQETSTNFGLGFTATPVSDLTLTVDAYHVEIKDRIVLTGAFDQSDPDIGADLVALNVGAAQFFTNALDTKTDGADVDINYAFRVDRNRFNLSFAGNFNYMELGEIHTTPKLANKKEIYFSRREQHFLLASAPRDKMNMSLDYGLDQFHANVRFTHFGQVVLTDYDPKEYTYDPKVTTDVSLGYDIVSGMTLIVGAANVFDVYPTKQDDSETETGGAWDAVQMGFSGRFMFARLNFKVY
jgi:iron complex outermembrane receptor protein